MIQRIYLAGPMTGLPEHNFPPSTPKPRAYAASGTRSRTPPSTARFRASSGPTTCGSDLQKLLTCQATALLPGWMDSKGARLEFTVATNLGMRALHAEHITGPAENAR